MLPSLQELRGLAKHVPQKRFRKLGNGRNRSDLPFEALMVDQHPSKANFNSFVTTRPCVVPWILAITDFYSTKCDVNVRIVFTYFDEGTEVAIGAKCITKVRLQLSSPDDPNKILHTFSIHLKTGLLTTQGSKYKEVGRNDFTQIKTLVDSLAGQSDEGPLNSTSLAQSPNQGASTMAPDVSPIKEQSRESEDEFFDSVSDIEENTSDATVHERTVLNQTLSVACGNIDKNIISLKESLQKSNSDNSNTLKKLMPAIQAISTSTKDIKNTVDLLSKSNGKMESDITALRSDVSKIVTMLKELKQSKVKKDVETMTSKFDNVTGEPLPDGTKKKIAAAGTTYAQVTQKDEKKAATAPSAPAAQPAAPLAPPTDTTKLPPVASKWNWVRDSTTIMNSKTENVVLADSLPRDVDQNVLDPSGLTQVKTYGGATVSTLCKKIAQFPKCNRVREVLCHIGFNDSQSTNPMTRTNLSLLMNNIHSKFPHAKVTFSSVLPTKYGYLTKINDINEILSEHCRNKQVKLVDFGQKFLHKPELYSDKDGDNVHLGDKGTEILLQQFKQTLGLNPAQSASETSHTNGNGTTAVQNPIGQPIETVITPREEQDSENSACKEDSARQNENEIQDNVPKIDFVNIEAASVRHGNIFQAFGSKCKSRKEVNEFCAHIKKEFPATKDASSFMVAYSFDLNGTKVTGYDNDGENGAGPRMQKMMDIIGMQNSCVIISRHYKGKMFAGRWTVIQEQMSKVARLLGYSVPSSMNIHTFYPRLGINSKPESRREEYRIQPPIFMSDRNQSAFQMTSDQWNMLQWQLLMSDKLSALCQQNVYTESCR